MVLGQDTHKGGWPRCPKGQKEGGDQVHKGVCPQAGEEGGADRVVKAA